MANSVTAPAEVIRPIWLPMPSVNHRLPSGPVVIEVGRLFAERGNSVSVVVLAETAQGSPAIAMISTLHSRVLTTRAMDRIPLLLNLPLERAGGDDGCLRHHRPVHHPHGHVTALCVAPDQVSFAI